MRSKYKVIDEYEAIERFYGNADTEYVDDCQMCGIPQHDLDFLIGEWGESIMDLLEEI